jgi:malate permease and related proteins
MLVFNVLGPVFGLIALGAVLDRSGFFSPSFLKEGNRVTYWLGLPALLFSELVASFRQVTGESALVLAALLGATCAVLVVGYVLARLLALPSAQVGTFVQAGFRGNLAFVGLPILVALPQDTTSGGLTLKNLAILVLAPTMVFYNAVGIGVLVLAQSRSRAHPERRWNLWPFLRQLALTPPLLATLAGITFATLGWRLPEPFERSFALLGDLALPLGLLCVGGALAQFRLHGNWRWTLVAALTKSLISPALGWLVAQTLGFGPAETRVVLLFMACPTAIVTYTVAVELGGDGQLASGVIAMSCLTSLAALIALLAWI